LDFATGWSHADLAYEVEMGDQLSLE